MSCLRFFFSPEMPLKQFNVGLREDGSFWSLGGRPSSAFSFYISFLVAIDGVASLGFVPAGFVSSPSTLQIFQEVVNLSTSLSTWSIPLTCAYSRQYSHMLNMHTKKNSKKKCRTYQNVTGKPLYLYRQFPTSIFSSCRKHWCISSDRLRGWWVVAMTTTGYCFCCDVSSVMFR